MQTGKREGKHHTITLIDGIGEELIFTKYYPPQGNLEHAILNMVYLALILINSN